MIIQQYMSPRKNLLNLSSTNKHTNKILAELNDNTNITKLSFDGRHLKNSDLLQMLPRLLYINTLIIHADCARSIIVDLFNAVLKSDTIIKITFSGETVSTFPYASLSNYLKQTKNLKSLCVEVIDLPLGSAKNMALFADAICVNTTLQKLSLTIGEPASEEGLYQLGNAIATNNTLQKFKLNTQNVVNPPCLCLILDKICPGLIKNKSIKFFQLGAVLCDKNILNINNILASNHTIDSYDFSRCKLPQCVHCPEPECQLPQNVNHEYDSRLMKTLTDAIDDGRIRHIATCPSWELYLSDVSKFLCPNKQLRCLNISGYTLTKECIITFFSTLCENSTLETLLMNSVNLRGLTQNAAEVIIKNNCLTNLDISNAGISDAHHIINALQFNTSLKILDISGNSMGSSFDGIAQMLTNNTCLANLSLQNFGLNSEALNSIAQGLAINTSLTALNTSYNKLSHPLLNNFVKTLFNTNFTLVDLSLGGKYDDELVTYLERNKSIFNAKLFKN